MGRDLRQRMMTTLQKAHWAKHAFADSLGCLLGLAGGRRCAVGHGGQGRFAGWSTGSMRTAVGMS